MKYNNNYKNNSKVSNIFNIVKGFLYFDVICLTFVSSLALMRVDLAIEEDVMTAFGGELGETGENHIKVEVDVEVEVDDDEYYENDYDYVDDYDDDDYYYDDEVEDDDVIS